MYIVCIHMSVCVSVCVCTCMLLCVFAFINSCEGILNPTARQLSSQCPLMKFSPTVVSSDSKTFPYTSF